MINSDPNTTNQPTNQPTKKQRQIVCTAALIYANGALHLGHLVEYIQADIWTRFQKMRGHEVYYICGNDCHGTPIMLKAEQEQISPEELIKRVTSEQLADFAQYEIAFDAFASTHCSDNKQLVNALYHKLRNNQDIISKTIEQAYDPERAMFLPDRYVKGTCPKCGATDQYGDNCEQCGATYNSMDLIEPKSVLSGATPITKASEHYFFKLSHYETFLSKWLSNNNALQSEVKNKLQEWFASGLQDWDISRDAPYFGFIIPGTSDKYFYVWLDAPIGYMASFQQLCAQQQLSFEDFWAADSQAELYHFIGKDIIYFHALFWPAMLKAANYRLPTAIYAHSFLTVNGKKMSKSRGTFITAKQFAQHIDPILLRYYFAAKLSSSIEDIDFSLTDFQARVNSDLVGKFINIASRCAGFIHKKFASKLNTDCINEPLLQQAISANTDIAKAYEQREFHLAMRQIMALADSANQYIAQHQPWQLVKSEQAADHELAHQVCSVALNIFRLLVIYLKPVLPSVATQAETFLNIAPMTWQDVDNILTDHEINSFKPLLQRVSDDMLNQLIPQ